MRREKHGITRHYNAELQASKQIRTTSKHSVEFTYSDFPYHLKVNRDKLTLIILIVDGSVKREKVDDNRWFTHEN